MESKNKNENQFHTFESYQPSQQPPDAPKKKRFAQANAWLKKHQRAVLIGVVAGIILIGGGLLYFIAGSNIGNIAVNPLKKQAEKIYSPLTGVEVDEEASKRPVTAVIIENSPQARPQSGLKEGGVVFEAIAEAGITRFLVFYQEAEPEILGPVRSLRPYYVDWLAAFDPSIAHVGGSVNALREIRDGGYKDIDQSSNGNSYWRARDRRAPHNVYTNFERLNELNQKKGYTNSSFTGFPRKSEKKVNATNATSISVPISSPQYNSTYTYNAESNSYLRSQAGSPHIDREKGQINPKVVIVIETPMSIVMEDGYREQIQTIGNGKATIFQDGIATVATWTKKDKKSQITFSDEAGKPIKLNRGQTWITVIATGKTPTWQ